MQKAVYRGMDAIGPHIFHHPITANKTLMADMERAVVHTQEIANLPAQTIRSSATEAEQ